MFLISLANSLPRLASIDGLLVLRRRPLGVAAHRTSSVPAPVPLLGPVGARPGPRTARAPGGRRSARGGSWWPADAPWRTATILPSAGPPVDPAEHLDARPGLLHPRRPDEHGVHRAAGAARRQATSASKESTCRPKALRRTVTSSPPMVCWSGRPSRIRSASRIIPAQDPYAGRPPAIALRSGSSSPNRSASLAIVVDSPPGSTSPSTASSSSGRRTGTASAPSRAARARCSRTSPCSASTPMTGGPALTSRGWRTARSRAAWRR